MQNEFNKSPYEDIINLPHHRSKTHAHMSMQERAAQFSPFSALTGHEEAVKETARLTDKKLILSDDEKLLLNRKLSFISENLSQDFEYSFTYFVPDERKSGGAYKSRQASVKKLDSLQGFLILSDASVIEISQIIAIESDAFYRFQDFFL